jgi:thiamine pyrophosphokinase
MGRYNSEMKRILIFGNGRLYKKFLQEIRKGDFVIGVDRSAYWLLTQKIIPDVAIGDFDSTTKEELASITKSIRIVKKFSSEKNWTDMELAITHANTLHPKETVIFGATGTRLDHTLANFHLLQNHILIDKNNRIRLIGRGKTIIKKASYRYISILPYTKSISVSLTGFRYNLPKTKISRGTTIGVSNELRGKEGTIRLFSGRAWVIESRD